MTRYAPLWQQAGSYPAQLDRYLLGALWPGGGVLGGVVTAVANTMTVSIAPGSVAVPLAPGQGTALCHWDAAEVVTLDAAPPSGQSRVDLIVAQVRDAAIDAGANNDFIFAVVKGTAALTATGRPGAEEGDDDEPEAEQQASAPAVPANALALYAVTVPGGAANLNGATIAPVTLNPLAVPANDLVANPAGRIAPNGPTGPFAANTLTAVNLNGVDYLRGGFTTAGFSLVVPVTGIYNVAWSAVFNASGGANIPATYLNAWLTLNGAGVRCASASPNSSVPSVGQSDNLNLRPGDRLSMSVVVGAGGIYCATVNNATFVGASLISR